MRGWSAFWATLLVAIVAIPLGQVAERATGTSPVSA
jgi:hypothetical protein